MDEVFSLHTEKFDLYDGEYDFINNNLFSYNFVLGNYSNNESNIVYVSQGYEVQAFPILHPGT